MKILTILMIKLLDINIKKVTLFGLDVEEILLEMKKVNL